jgi:Recombination endonuclease VII
VKICLNPARERGWCGGHYKRWQKNGDVRADIPLQKRTPRPILRCTHGCNEPQYARGWCAKCYDDWFDSGGYEQTAKFLAHSGDNVRTCASCRESKPVDDFTWRQGMTVKRERVRHSWCKTCISAKSRVQYLANQEQRKSDAAVRYADIRADPERFLLYSLRIAATKLNLDFGIVAEHFATHNGLCDICGDRNIDPNRTRLTIDHDHDTGEFRGILCSNCNRAIGLLRDSSKQALAAAAYLESRGR